MCDFAFIIVTLILFNRPLRLLSKKAKALQSEQKIIVKTIPNIESDDDKCHLTQQCKPITTPVAAIAPSNSNHENTLKHLAIKYTV